MIDVYLVAGRERSVLRRHPWILSGSVERVGGIGAAPGALARVLAQDGRVLGFGHFSPESQIRVRLFVFGNRQIDFDAHLEVLIEAAIRRRATDPLLAGTDAVRLINSEADWLPGLTVDRFKDVAVVKLTTAGMAVRRERIVAALQRAAGVTSCIERADATAARREGFEAQDGLLFGSEPPEHIEIDERGRRYLVDVARGQKTGFYLDQRDARDLVEKLAPGRSVLDLYSHTGGFAVAAARGGAKSVVLVESSADALALAERNMAANAPDVVARFERGDVHKFLREDTERYDVVVVDPPPLAKTKRDVDRAARAYKDSFLYAMKRAADDAFVLVFSCSHHVGPELLGQITFGAALDAGRTFQVLRSLGQPSDHPVSVDHPEGSYLSGLLLRTGV